MSILISKKNVILMRTGELLVEISREIFGRFIQQFLCYDICYSISKHFINYGTSIFWICGLNNNIKAIGHDEKLLSLTHCNFLYSVVHLLWFLGRRNLFALTLWILYDENSILWLSHDYTFYLNCDTGVGKAVVVFTSFEIVIFPHNLRFNLSFIAFGLELDCGIE